MRIGTKGIRPRACEARGCTIDRGRAIRWSSLVAGLTVLGLVSLGTGAPPSRPSPLRLEGVSIWNPGIERVELASLEVRGDRIVSIERHPIGGSSPVKPSGLTVLPGLVDMHVHLPASDAELSGLALLAHGVTVVRDVGDSEGDVFAFRRRIESGVIPGPRVFACGPIVDGEDPVWPGSRVAENAASARRVAREIADLGADCVKAYRRLDEPALRVLAEAAHRASLQVVGHVPDGLPFTRASLDDVQHLTGFLPGTPPSGFTDRVRWIASGWLALDPERIRSIVDLSIEKGVAHTPTLVFYERLFRLSTLEEPMIQLVSPDLQVRSWDLVKPWSATREDRLRFEQVTGRMGETVLALHEAGVPIHAGTDAVNPFLAPGSSLHREVELLARAGLSNAEVVAAASTVPARFLGLDGRIREGASADFVVVRGDPERELAALSQIELVVSRGEAHRPEELLARIETLREPGVVARGWTNLLDALGFFERGL